LIDDLTATAVSEMKKSGFQPAVVTETSPGNFQAWLKHAEILPKDLGTAAARALAARFQGDRGAAIGGISEGSPGSPTERLFTAKSTDCTHLSAWSGLPERFTMRRESSLKV
jgi:hypothetical protein